MFLNAGPLYRHAVAAYELITGPDDRSPGHTEALTSIVFAASSLEAFINEAPHALSVPVQYPAGDQRLRVLRDALDELEDGRGTIQSKFLLAKFVLSGESFDKGSSPYQEFALLVKVRNEIVHIKAFEEVREFTAGDIKTRKHPLTESLRSLGVLGEIDYSQYGDVDPEKIVRNWLDDLCTKAMAKWACNAAAGMVRGIVEVIPKAEAHVSLVRYYADLFQPIA